MCCSLLCEKLRVPLESWTRSKSETCDEMGFHRLAISKGTRAPYTILLCASGTFNQRWTSFLGGSACCATSLAVFRLKGTHETHQGIIRRSSDCETALCGLPSGAVGYVRLWKSLPNQPCPHCILSSLQTFYCRTCR